MAVHSPWRAETDAVPRLGNSCGRTSLAGRNGSANHEVWIGGRAASAGEACIQGRRVVESSMDAKREAEIKLRFEAVAATADERTRRRLAGAEAKAMGRGGVAAVVRAT